MHKFSALLKSEDFKLFLIGFILSLSLLWPLFASPYFSHHDDVQVIRLYEMNKCFQDLQIPCRWVPDLGGVYGYPIFNYYAPLPYYVGEIFYLVTGSLLFSAKMMFALPFLGAYVFMFLLGRRVWGGIGGLISGVFYSFAPYHALDMYVRGAMGEIWALMFFPAIIWGLFRLQSKPSLGNSLILSLSFALLILSHNLSTMIFVPVFIGFAAILLFFKWSWKFLTQIVIAGALAFLIVSFYLLPVIFEKNLVHVDTTTYGYFSYTEHFKGFKKTILDRSWGWGASVREVPGGEKDGLSFQIGWIHLIALLLSLWVVKTIWSSDKQKSYLLLVSFILIVFSIYMIHPQSLSIWQLIDPLKYLQFPWRFLVIIIFLISFSAGSMVLVPRGKKFIIAGMFFLVIALNFGYFTPEKFKNVTDEELLTGENWDIQIKRSIFDYLPIYAEAPPAELATSRYEVLSGNPKITNFQERSNAISFDVTTPDLTRIRLSQYYFPEWIITVDGKQVDVNYQNELGLMTFAVDPGKHKVEATFNDTPVRRIGNWLTLLGIILFTVLSLWQINKVRSIFRYLIKGLNR